MEHDLRNVPSDKFRENSVLPPENYCSFSLVGAYTSQSSHWCAVFSIPNIMCWLLVSRVLQYAIKLGSAKKEDGIYRF